MKPRSRMFRGGVFVLTLLATTVLVLALSASTSLGAPLDQSSEPQACKDCHPDEYRLWQDSTHASAVSNPRFQDALKAAPNEELCLQCHTTGPDTATGSGISCEACHGPYIEGHPGEATMVLPMESETCRTCHEAAFTEWENSTHGSSNIECFDCHLSHSQGLRTGSEETLCSACHEPREMEATHVTHRIDGMDCSGCHMPAEITDAHDVTAVPITSSTHGFGFEAQACIDCHNQIGNTEIALPVEQELAMASPELEFPMIEQAATTAETQALERRLASLRNVAVAGMGLAFGIGGFLGLVAGLVVMALVRRPHESEDKRSAS